MNYYIEGGSNTFELAKKVNVATDAGWRVFGGPFSGPSDNGKHFFQAMIMTSEPGNTADGKHRCHVCGAPEGTFHKNYCSVGEGVFRR